MNKQTCEQLTKDIAEYLEFSDRDKISPLILWDACKAVMRGRIIAITSNIKKSKVAKLQMLQSELLDLEATYKNTIATKTKLKIAKKLKSNWWDIHSRRPKETNLDQTKILWVGN